MRRLKWLFPLLAISIIGIALAGEVESGAPTADVPWWLTLLSLEGVQSILKTVIFLLISALLSLVFGKKWKEGQYAEAIEALKAGVEKVYEEQVRQWKKNASDGKLSDEERAKARALALEHAKLLAKGPGLKLLSTWGKDKIASLIADIIAKRKSKKATS